MLTKMEQCLPFLSLSLCLLPRSFLSLFFAVMFAIKIASVTRFGTRQGSLYVWGGDCRVESAAICCSIVSLCACPKYHLAEVHTSVMERATQSAREDKHNERRRIDNGAHTRCFRREKQRSFFTRQQTEDTSTHTRTLGRVKDALN